MRMKWRTVHGESEMIQNPETGAYCEMVKGVKSRVCSAVQHKKYPVRRNCRQSEAWGPGGGYSLCFRRPLVQVLFWFSGASELQP